MFLSVLWLTQVGYFILNFPWLIFLVRYFFANYWNHLLSFLKNHKVIMSLTFALFLICFTTCIMIKILETSFPAKPVSSPNQFPRQTNIGCKKFIVEVICFILAYFENNLHSRLCYYFVVLRPKNKKKKKIKSDRSIGFYWSVLRKFFFFKNSFFDSIGTSLLAMTSFYFS